MPAKQAIGVFDSGFGGLTVLKEIVKKLPQYDYIYLGDNARAPYGNRSFETVYHYTLQCVEKLFSMNCNLVIVACNTSSAKALRNIQQLDLPQKHRGKRVLGVIRPTTEIVGNFSQSKKIGVLGTKGTVASGSYPIEIGKFFPDVQVFQEACPMWVPLVENNEHLSIAADYFVKKNLDNLFSQSAEIDVIILACTHYPLLLPVIEKYVPENVILFSQGTLVANALSDYLKRHPEMEKICSKGASREFFTSDSAENFNEAASIFYGKKVSSQHIEL